MMAALYPSFFGDKRYYSLNQYFRGTFHSKVCKVAIDAGFTCPNRDGSKGIGGCTFCSAAGSGEFAGSRSLPISVQLEQGSKMMAKKWGELPVIAYFQAFTNTYAPLSALRQRYEEALALPNVVGLSIATRPDCLPNEVFPFLRELNNRTHLTLELGLQTVHDSTAKRINRCYCYAEFLESYCKLKENGIAVCIHLINGLPGEDFEQMLASTKQVAQLSPHSVKIHLLHVLKNTALSKDYHLGKYMPLSRDEYVSLVCRQLTLLPPSVVIERLTGDGKRDALEAPLWSLQKRKVLNAIDGYLRSHALWQGKFYEGNGKD